MDEEALEILKKLDSLENDFETLCDDTHNSYEKVLSSIDNFSSNITALDEKFEELTQLKKVLNGAPPNEIEITNVRQR